MNKFVVMWSHDGIYTERNMKIMDEFNAAQWFAKALELKYNYVKVYEARKGEGYE
tara:strand:- start:1936 stop:2100 length:165 start_codon:yes stop_codon:yes gene_type:complete